MAAKRVKTVDLDSYATKRDLRDLGTELRGEIGELRGEVGGLRGEVVELRGEVGELRGEVGELRGEVGELRGDVGELRGEMRANAVHFENVVVTTIRALGEKIDGMNERFQRDMAALEQRLGDRITVVENATRTLATEVRRGSSGIE